MSPWGWKPEHSPGIWRYGATWLRPFVAAVPYITIALLLMMFHFLEGRFASASGVLFDLPDSGLVDGERPELVALVLPMKHETLVFFDDSRYVLDDPASVRAFGENLFERLSRSERKALLVLADRRVSGGELMNLAAVAKKNGVKRILFAEKTEKGDEKSSQ